MPLKSGSNRDNYGSVTSLLSVRPLPPSASVQGSLTLIERRTQVEAVRLPADCPQRAATPVAAHDLQVVRQRDEAAQRGLALPDRDGADSAPEVYKRIVFPVTVLGMETAAPSQRSDRSRGWPTVGYAATSMRVSDRDLTAVARIRNAALEGFARDGVAATSIRDVARAAGVSPGLVQHHFKTKAELERAVNEYVVQIATEAYEGFEEISATATTDELLQAMGDRITVFVREHRSALLYVIRSAAQGEEAGLNIFDAFLALIDTQVQRLAEEGTLRADIDRLWLGLHVVIFNLGTVLLEPALDRHLPAPFRDPAQLERWNKASTQLFTEGAVKSRRRKRREGG